jgi:choline dehydrogenase-like flavoprotein
MLGGSTGINYMGWHRASKIEYDAWKLLSDPEGAWDSDEMFYFLKRAEAAVPASENQDIYTSFSRSRDDVVDYGIPRSEVVGTEGPVKVRVCLPVFPLSDGGYYNIADMLPSDLSR